jgi:hypothetical protein
MTEPTRRQALALAAASAAAPLLPAIASESKGETLAAVEAALPRRWWLLTPLRQGEDLGSGYTVQDVYGPLEGAVIVVLARGTQFVRVHLCKNGGAPAGLAHTARFDLLVMNDGRGNAPTDEALGLAVMALGRVIAAREAADPSVAAFASDLSTHADRLARGGGQPGVLR